MRFEPLTLPIASSLIFTLRLPEDFTPSFTRVLPPLVITDALGAAATPVALTMKEAESLSSAVVASGEVVETVAVFLISPPVLAPPLVRIATQSRP